MEISRRLLGLVCITVFSCSAAMAESRACDNTADQADGTVFTVADVLRRWIWQ